MNPAETFKAVGDPTRLRLLRLLSRTELNVQEMVQILGMSQPGVSKHLKVLLDAGWLIHRKEGTWSWYGLVSDVDFAGGPEFRRVVLEGARLSPDAVADDAVLQRVLAERDRRSGAFFSDIAGSWDMIRPAFDHPDVQAGAVGALVPPGLELVDIGTGTGALLPLLAATGARITAVDASAAMLTRARGLCEREGLNDVAFEQADIQDLPFADDRFDAAYCSMVLHHVARPERALREMTRVVKPGGKVVVMAFTRHNLVWLREELAHQWLGFSRDEMEDLFARLGLRAARYLECGLSRLAAAREKLPPGLRGRDEDWPDVFLTVGVKHETSR
ncbi:metalloregulator ArsR/SmtB family transcription factor [bacterium]|nr:metalloregulator ArsR/SmtB family transcription factor [bacterium]MBU1071660.1 metalloregulator ArsR/SmtB family transcription factor [bacterium]MBU1676404.1 metalloregulator ArsR/SmtB family transcription factor [bacterium]